MSSEAHLCTICRPAPSGPGTAASKSRVSCSEIEVRPELGPGTSLLDGFLGLDPESDARWLAVFTSRLPVGLGIRCAGG